MKFSNQALVCLIKTFQKALIEGVDISDILTDMRFQVTSDKLEVLNPEITDLNLPSFENLNKELNNA